MSPYSRVINVVGVKESAGLNIFLALADFFTQLVLVVIGLVLVFSPDTLVNNVDLWDAPSLANFLIAIPVGMVAYTGIETISNMAEEARDYGRTIPRGMAGVVVAVFAIYTFLPAVALSAMPVENGETQLALPKEEGATRTTRSSAWSRTWSSARSSAPPRSTSASSPPRSSSSRPTPA